MDSQTLTHHDILFAQSWPPYRTEDHVEIALDGKRRPRITDRIPAFA